MKRALVIVLLFVLLVGCAPVSAYSPTATPVPPTATLVPATATATIIPATPTATPTPTEVPPTETPTITSTPDYTDFAKFTPEAAEVNEAQWNGLNIKFAQLEYSSSLNSINPKQAPFLRSFTWPEGKVTANIIFFVDQCDLMGVKINNQTYFEVTFSDGEKEVVDGSYYDKGGTDLIRGYFCSANSYDIGEIQINFLIPEEGMKLVELKIAENSGMKDEAVTIYKK